MTARSAEAASNFAAVRSVLLTLRVPRAPAAAGQVPVPEVEWPILVTFDEPVARERCLELFDETWRNEHDALLYALPPDGGWMRAAIDDAHGPATYQAVQIAVRLPGDSEPRSELGLERLLADVTGRAASLGALLTEARYPLESAVARADQLSRLRDFIDSRDEGCVHVRVDKSEGFRSEDVEQVLADLGFDARRGGLLVWSNDSDCVGDDPIIGASLEDDRRLALWFAVPRVAEPFAVLDAVIAVAALVVSTLGGSIVDEQGGPLNVLALRASVADLVERMRAANLVPGETGLSLV